MVVIMGAGNVMAMLKAPFFIPSMHTIVRESKNEIIVMSTASEYLCILKYRQLEIYARERKKRGHSFVWESKRYLVFLFLCFSKVGSILPCLLGGFIHHYSPQQIKEKVCTENAHSFKVFIFFIFLTFIIYRAYMRNIATQLYLYC